MDALALNHRRTLVDTGRLVRAAVLLQVIGAKITVTLTDLDRPAGHRDHLAIRLSHDQLAGVNCRMGFHSRGDDGDFWTHQRHSLGLHVRAHQGAVGIIMLKEGD